MKQTKLLAVMAQGGISLYQNLAAIKVQLLQSAFGYASVCHHQPSCSRYTQDQIKQHGTIVGLWRGLGRLATCW